MEFLLNAVVTGDAEDGTQHIKHFFGQMLTARLAHLLTFGVGPFKMVYHLCQFPCLFAEMRDNAYQDGRGNLVLEARKENPAHYQCWNGTCQYTQEHDP